MNKELLEDYAHAVTKMAQIETRVCQLADLKHGIFVTPAMLRVLLLVHTETERDNSPSTTEIARLLQVTPQAVSRQTYEATVEELLTKTRDSADVRLRRLALTSRGKKVMQVAADVCAEYSREVV